MSNMPLGLAVSYMKGCLQYLRDDPCNHSIERALESVEVYDSAEDLSSEFITRMLRRTGDMVKKSILEEIS